MVLRSVGSALSWTPHGGKLNVLIYHRVPAETDPLLPDEPCARVFDWQMATISANFRVLGLEEAIERLQNRSLPRRSLCITFDDGYADNAAVALPILLKHRLTATFFITTGVLDGGRMWNDSVIEAIRVVDSGVLDLESWGVGVYQIGDAESRKRAVDDVIRSIKYRPSAEREEIVAGIARLAGRAARSDLMMTSEQVRMLARSRMEIGAHTVTHPLLKSLSDGDAHREIADSRDRLRDILGRDVRLFAYPNGKPGKDYVARDVSSVRELGFSGAVSTAWGAGTSHSDPLQVPRFTPWDRTPRRFVMRLLHNYTRTNEQRA
jgi:peptidoglycan/xylan/chitin deacetylase (PgdA/CDA1 family)